MSSWARVGAKCVCIKRGKWETISLGRSRGGCPIFGEVCLITDVSDDGFIKISGYEHQFDIRRFRPLIPAKTQADDIALFTPLLISAPELVE